MGDPILANNKSSEITPFGFVWAFESMITFHNITVLYSGYLWKAKFSTIHFVQCTTSTFSLNTFHLYHQFSFVASINMRLEVLNSLLIHPNVNYPLLNVFFFRYKVIHWWNAVPIDILTSATFKDDLFLFMCKFLQLICVCNNLSACLCCNFSAVYVCCHFCMFVRMLYMCFLPGKNGIANWLVRIKSNQIISRA